jgi:hypothetical protein
MKKTPAIDRFWAKVNKKGPDECWIWKGFIEPNKGYGRFTDGKDQLAHRVAYKLLVGPIPKGKQLDHVRTRGCINNSCVNPAHLEPVTNRENCQRSIRATKSKCIHGHIFNELNTRYWEGQRICRICERQRGIKYRSKTIGV